MHNKFQNLYASQNIIRVTKSRRMRWVGHVAGMDEMRNLYQILVGKHQEPLGRPRRRWEDNIRMDLSEIEWEGVDWTHLHLDRDQWWALVNTVMNLRAPLKVRGISYLASQESPVPWS
jgi:hypothetical protein